MLLLRQPSQLVYYHDLSCLYFSVLPLAISTGAGAAGGDEIGIAVIGGMISATVLAIFFVPVFFVLVMRYFTKYVPAEMKKQMAENEKKRLEELYRKSREADEARKLGH